METRHNAKSSSVRVERDIGRIISVSSELIAELFAHDVAPLTKVVN